LPKKESKERGNAMKMTSIVILNYNTLDCTKLCIESIRHYTKKGRYEIIVVDNASVDGSVEWLKLQSDLRCIYNEENFGFPKGCNQGIAIATGSAILLLNSDTIVTPRWLEQLELALYSSEKIGAVSCVTNSCSNFQKISIPYKNMSEMISFANDYNKTDPKKWEERLKLVGFCFLVKRSVVEKIGGLDELFSPGNYEDDDYSLRIIEAGYTLLVCKDTFIHHFGSLSFTRSLDGIEFVEKQKTYLKFLKKNLAKFEKKWGLSDGYQQERNKEVVANMGALQRCSGRILEIGCGCGADLLTLKKVYPEAAISGIDSDEQAVRIAACLAEVQVCKDIENDVFSLLNGQFDAIVLGDIVEHVKKPKLFLTKISNFLSDNGMIFIGFHNAMYWPTLKKLFSGVGINHRGLTSGESIIYPYTLKDIQKLFFDLPYKNVAVTTGIGNIERDELFIQKAIALGVVNQKDELDTALWLVSAVKQIEVNNAVKEHRDAAAIQALNHAVQTFAEQENQALVCEKIWKGCQMAGISLEELVEIVKENSLEPVENLISLALFIYQKEQIKDSLRMLIICYKNWPDHENLLYTLAFLLDLQQEHQGAWEILRVYKGQNENILQLRNQLEGKYQS
jgi:GT2 family glycosyltransferase